MVIFNPFYIKNESCILHNESRKNTHKHTKKKKKLERDLVRTFSRAGEPPRAQSILPEILCASRRCCETCRPRDCTTRATTTAGGEEDPFSAAPEEFLCAPLCFVSLLPMPSYLSLSLVSSRRPGALARFASVCFWRRKILDFEIQEAFSTRDEKTLFCYSPFSRKYHHLQEPQDPDRELASPRVLCWGSNSSPRWQNYRSSRRRGVSGGSAAPLRPLSPPPPPPPTPALWL